jgi:hypothetical protein
MNSRQRRRGAYPGSFNPPTTAHLAIVEAAFAQCALDRIDLVVSRVPLAKGIVDVPSLAHRIEVLEASVGHDRRISVVVTDLQLIADIATGYDVVIMGADKWHQIHEVGFYGSAAERDRAVGSLPEVALAPRPPAEAPAELVLEVSPEHAPTSSSRARDGEIQLMTAAAQAFDQATGAWSDPDRYLARAGRPGDGQRLAD